MYKHIVLVKIISVPSFTWIFGRSAKRVLNVSFRGRVYETVSFFEGQLDWALILIFSSFIRKSTLVFQLHILYQFLFKKYLFEGILPPPPGKKSLINVYLQLTKTVNIPILCDCLSQSSLYILSAIRNQNTYPRGRQ